MRPVEGPEAHDEHYHRERERESGWLFWFVVAVIGGLLIGKKVLAHDAMSGWEYPWRCCHDKDCWQLPAGAVKESSGGFTLTANGEFIPQAEAEPSGDEFFHLCRLESGKRLCFFYPPRGF